MTSQPLHDYQPGDDPDPCDSQPAGAHPSGVVGAGLRNVPAWLLRTAVNTTWLLAHLGSYPLCVAADRTWRGRGGHSLQGVPPSQRGLLHSDVEAAFTPVLLVHGLMDNRSVFTLLGRSLRRQGFMRVTGVNLPLRCADLETAADRLATRVESLCEQAGSPRVHIVAHSLGGLVARYYVQCMAGDSRVHTLVTLGTPHEGTRRANLIPGRVSFPLLTQLRPGSSLLAELARPAPGCRTRFVAFAGDRDTLIAPRESALVRHPDLISRNVTVPHVGHHGLAYAGAVARDIATTLACSAPGTRRLSSVDHRPSRVGTGAGVEWVAAGR